MRFIAKEQPKLEEGVKVIGMNAIRKAVAVCEIEGEKSDACKKIMKEDLGIDIIE